MLWPSLVDWIIAMYSIVLFAHAAIGVLALIAYWTAALAKKGSPVHRAAGKVFMLTMLLILITAVMFVGRMLLREKLVEATFFAYLIVISATALATGWLSLRWKKSHGRYHGHWYQVLAAFNVLCGAAVLALGVIEGDPILIGFSMVGLVRGSAMWRLSMQAESPRWWLREHLGSMIGNGVAVHVAFLLVGLNRLLPPDWRGHTELIGWLLPLVVAGIAGVLFGRRYRLTPERKLTSANAA